MRGFPGKLPEDKPRTIQRVDEPLPLLNPFPPIKWTSISLDEAKQHPLYGVKGWLLLLAAGPGIGLALLLFEMAGLLTVENVRLGVVLRSHAPEVFYAKVVLTFLMLQATIWYWALLSRNVRFRWIATILYLSTWPVAVLLGLWFPFSSIGDLLGGTFLPWLVTCVLWIAYLHRSERVRVTFEQCVRGANEHAL